MTWKTMMASQAALACMFSYSKARIVEDSPLWTGKDWYDEASQIGVVNGVPYSNDQTTTRFMVAPVALEGEVPAYMSFENVQRVQSLFSEEDWLYMFPLRKSLYTYDGFLRAVGKYPKFCNEKGAQLSAYTDDMACERELAMLFAHFNQETGAHDPNSEYEFFRQGLAHITEWVCTPPQWGVGTASCDYAQTWDSWALTAYPPQAGKQYYGRGPFQLSWNYNYGAFSKVLVESTFDSHMYLLNNPDQVHTDSFTVFSSALWFYMTPQAPKPSIHDVAAGFMTETVADQNAGIVPGFGVTTNIINGGQECGGNWENTKSQYRIDTYLEMLDYFDLPAEDESTMTCGGQSNAFPDGGYGAAYSYFHYYSGDHCTIVNTQTPYHISTVDDYKRCQCRALASDINHPELDCPQDNAPPQPVCECGINAMGDCNECPIPPVCECGENAYGECNQCGDCECGEDANGACIACPYECTDPEEEFEEIWEKPHYDEATPSRTLYQVDRSLDYIETKLAEIHAVFKAKGMIQ